MEALVLEDNGKLIFKKDQPVPPVVGVRSHLIRVAACGICGSDIPRGFSGGAYHYPLVMGHEFSGVIEEAVDGSDFQKGDRVAVFPLLPLDENDKMYQLGNYAQVRDYNYFGSRCDGAYEELLWVPEINLFKIPEQVDIVHASMTEPAAVALHAVRKLHITAGNTSVVYGAGPIGNMTAQWLRIHGARQVIVIDIDKKKLDIASEMGFLTINSLEDDPVEKIKEMTDGHGAHQVVEAVGLPVTFVQALQSAGMMGEVVFLGNIHGKFEMGEKDFSWILRKELKIYGTWNSSVVPRGDDDWTTVLNYMDRELIVKPLISDLVNLADGPDIFQSIINRKKFHNKVIFKVS